MPIQRHDRGCFGLQGLQGAAVAVWALVAGLCLPVTGLRADCGTGTTIVVASPNDVTLYIPPAGAEPAGWQNAGFNDSAWTPASVWSGYPPVVLGGTWWSYSTAGTSVADTITATTDSMLVRNSFSLPLSATAITAVLEWIVDDNSTTYINGVAAQSDPSNYISGNVPGVVTLTAGLQPGPNLLAMRIISPIPMGIGYAYRLTLSYSFACPTPTPTITPTFTPSDSPTVTESFTVTPTFSVSPTWTPTPSVTDTFTPSPTPTVTATFTASPTISPTFSVSPTPTVTPTFYAATDLLRVIGLYPNPFADHLTAAYALAQPAHLTARIYNVAGEKVATAGWDAPAGVQTWVWGGVNDSGRRVASGAYVLLFEDAATDGSQGSVWERAAVLR